MTWQEAIDRAIQKSYSNGYKYFVYKGDGWQIIRASLRGMVRK